MDGLAPSASSSSSARAGVAAADFFFLLFFFLVCLGELAYGPVLAVAITHLLWRRDCRYGLFLIVVVLSFGLSCTELPNRE